MRHCIPASHNRPPEGGHTYSNVVRLKPDTTYGPYDVRLKPDTTYGRDDVRQKPDTPYAHTDVRPKPDITYAAVVRREPNTAQPNIVPLKPDTAFADVVSGFSRTFPVPVV